MGRTLPSYVCYMIISKNETVTIGLNHHIELFIILNNEASNKLALHVIKIIGQS